MAAVAGPQTPQRPLPGDFINTPAPQAPTIFAQQAATLRQNPQPPATNNGSISQSSIPQISPVQRGARTIDGMLAQEARFPELESYAQQGMSGEYELPTNPAWLPYQKLKMYDLPAAIIEQANQTVGGLQMGVMPVLSHCWAVMDNCLYLWDYTMPQPELIGFEENSHPITAVKLVRPKAGVFVKEITHLLVVATSDTMLLLGVASQATSTGAKTVSLYNTKMWIHTKGLNVQQIEASHRTGRIFFLDSGSEDIYEFQYQQEEGWFRGKCARICHTRSNYDFVPAPVKAVGSLIAPSKRQRVLKRLALDDSRDLLYTLSDTSEVKIWAVKEQVKLTLSRPMASLLQNTSHFTGRTDLLYAQGVQIVDLSIIPASEAGRLSVMATTNTGCRLYLSATRGYGGNADASNPPSSMQILHIRFPPRDLSAPAPQQQSNSTAVTPYNGGAQSNVDTSSRALTPTDAARRLPPGYFLAYQSPNSESSRGQRVFCAAPDFARLKNPQDTSSMSSRFVEYGQWIELPSAYSMTALVTPDCTSFNSPIGFGNELAVQFDRSSTEIAIMTADGVQTIRRRRLVDVFAAMMRYASTDEEGREGDIKRFVRTYGRGETAATALAVACGQGVDVSSDSRITAVTEPDVIEGARKAFIDHGGKPEYNANAVVERNAEPLDSVRPSPRHEGLALYISRLVRSIWSARVITEMILPGEPPRMLPTIPLDRLRTVQTDLNNLSGFLNRNRAFIEGLAGPPSQPGRPNSRQDEIANHGEHRAMTGLVQLIASIVEGISFALVLFDERIEEIFAALSEESRKRAKELRFEELFVSNTGRELAKELVKAIVNRNIANGSNVDTVAEALRRRCGSFCSAEDVVIFKAQEQVKRASEAGGQSETGRVLLNESQRLFSKVAANLSEEHLKWAVEQYVGMQFYAGAIQLCLVVAQERDRAKRAWGWVKEGCAEGDARKVEFEKRKSCYGLIFATIEALDRATNADGGQTPLVTRRRNEAYDVINGSDDAVFQTCLYDWYISIGQAERLLDVDSSHVIDYLKRRSQDHREHADLLWRYYAHHNDYLAAAATQLDLARGYFELSLEERIHYLSRARTNASTRTTLLMDSRQSKQQLLREIGDLLEVANIQDDILQRMKSDSRLTAERRETVLNQLHMSGILPLGDLFNQYSDQADYHDINLLIFHVADHRNPLDIQRSWSELVRSEENRSLADPSGPVPWERIGEKIRDLGRRLNLSESVFPVPFLLHLLEKWAIHPREHVPPKNWAVDIFLDLGVPHEVLLPELERLFYLGEHPFVGTKRRGAAGSMVYVIRQWVRESERKGESWTEESIEVIRGVLQGVLGEQGMLNEEGRREAGDLLAAIGGR
ncbi:hypothetical protein BAUCODRAFT_233569 [Baudoinia panamericana UAMH 10762]|uniref:Nucleoporin Nup133/Nup155-like N-terminal domain-containing protein n=1 Tax=Baudoinia panamericana (strain UAMH 10762) TaxID=717646 RepID=M2LGL8_BAUPA|nr:uncharacterized protein BAUCODRAFT_233569 [Baudoinia panamericana UAMH 10762]EMC93237.1 hypothetical protein BAUCODRAFT_233569 [Baudoinia panamericana UAMH 10762]